MNALDCLLRPRSVAIVGASGNVQKIGGRPLHYLQQHGFGGRIYPVSQHGGSVQGLASYRRLDDLPEAPDSVILSVPAESLLEQVESCVRVGAKSAILFSSGFAELGEEGRRLQAELVRSAARGGLRLLGPNTIGTSNFGCGAVLSFASIYQEFAPQDGPVAIVSQSGAVGVSAYAMLRENGIGARYVCSTGNQADVDVTQFLAAVLEDDSVRLVLVYLEDIGDPAALQAALARAQARGVPVLVLPGGRGARGVAMAQCHTGSSGVSTGAIRELFVAQNCRVVGSLAELTASAPLYLGARLPPATPRVGVLSNSGASCVMGADACEAHGLALAELSAATVAALDTMLPSFSRSRNPVDVTAMLLAEPDLLGRSVKSLLEDAQCDALALSLLAVAGPAYDVQRFAAETAELARATGKPVAFSSPDARVRQAFAARGVAVFNSEHEAVAALASHAIHYN